jgi:hypothetical protein
MHEVICAEYKLKVLCVIKWSPDFEVTHKTYSLYFAEITLRCVVKIVCII